MLRHGVLEDQVREIYLFDSSYGRIAPIVAQARKPGVRLWAMYTPHLRRATACLMDQLSDLPYFGCNPYASGACSGNPVLDMTCMRGRHVPAYDELRASLGFFPTPYGHGQVVRAYLADFLRAGAP